MMSMRTTTWWCAYQQKKVDVAAQTATIGYIGNSVILRHLSKLIHPNEANHS